VGTSAQALKLVQAGASRLHVIFHLPTMSLSHASSPTPSSASSLTSSSSSSRDTPPQTLLAGDVGTYTHHQSQTKEFIRLILEDYRGAITESQFTTYRHHCIVLGTVGRPLEMFQSTRELARAMQAALEVRRLFSW
jgi:hypothetical protein